MEIEIKNSDQHKGIVKARNEFYLMYKSRFQESIKKIMKTYDSYREEEILFNQYWNTNLKEITVKHI